MKSSLRRRIGLQLSSVALLCAASGCTSLERSAPGSSANRSSEGVAAPASQKAPAGAPVAAAPPSRMFEGRAVEGHVRQGVGLRGESSLPARGLFDLKADPTPRPMMIERPIRARAEGPIEGSAPSRGSEELLLGGVGDLVTSFASTTFDENSTYNGGFYYVPPDCSLAAGPSYVITVVNTVMKLHNKSTGAAVYTDDLSDFFAGVAPETDTFDPKVLWDEFADRWLIVTLEKVGTTAGVSANNKSKVLLGVSDDADPIGTWYIVSLNVKQNIGSVDHWFDYPGFAVDEEAIYITGNMFSHVSNAPGGGRVLIVEKSDFYAGISASSAIYDPNTLSGNVFPSIPLQPAHVFPPAPSGDLGTFLVGFSGLADASFSYVCTIRIDDPIGTPTFTGDCTSLGSMIGSGVGDAPQSGTGTLIDNGDRRTLDADLRHGNLWATATVVPTSGANTGDSTAFFLRLDVSPPDASPLPLAELGYLGGEDLGTDTFTTYASAAVNPLGRAVFGFSSFRSTSFASARFAAKKPSDAAGATGASQTLATGVAKYIRTFGTGNNRWGDYSGTAVDPVDGCFWLLNEYADTEGTDLGLGELGRWATRVGKICPDGLIFADDFGAGMKRWITPP